MIYILSYENFNVFQENLLERVCYRTEFEVEGWRKIPPLMEILNKNISIDMISTMKLKLITRNPIIGLAKFKDAVISLVPEKLVDEENKRIRTIKESWIYTHFTKLKKRNGKVRRIPTENTKIAIYVNAILPINENLDGGEIGSVGNHSVLVKGITDWKYKDNETIECLELENHGGSAQTRYIPVDHPFFEEVQVKVMRIFRNGRSDHKRRLNTYGEKLATIKWGKMKKNWHEQNYEMLFVRAIHPCYQLKFIAELGGYGRESGHELMSEAHSDTRLLETSDSYRDRIVFAPEL